MLLSVGASFVLRHPSIDLSDGPRLLSAKLPKQSVPRVQQCRERRLATAVARQLGWKRLATQIVALYAAFTRVGFGSKAIPSLCPSRSPDLPASLPNSLSPIGAYWVLADTQTDFLGSSMNLPYGSLCKHLGTMGE